MCSQNAKRLLLSALAGLGLAVSISAAAANDKISNNTNDLKAALKASGVSSSSQALAGTAGTTKIAALQVDDLKSTTMQAMAPSLAGDLVQGGLIRGQTLAGAQVKLDDIDVSVDAEGRFLLGFHRDHPSTATLSITLPDGTKLSPKELEIAPGKFKEERIDGLPSNKVNEFSPEELEKIRIGTEKKNAARRNMSEEAFWISGFDWPVTGRISGLFGSQRILNGVPRRPHSGVDVAAPEGKEIKAPADGIITLAETDMYFEGGLVFIDHGQGLESAIMHMSRVDVQVGEMVRQGDVIGAVGATGRATGNHMHWSLKWKKRLLNAQLVVPEMP